MESKKINQLATELAPDLSDLTIIGDPTTGISKKITLSQMASLFTGTVEEYANFAAFPLVGVADTIYIAKDTNVIYRWDSTAYVVLSPNIIASLVFNDANGFDGTIALVGSVATLTITTALTSGSVPFIGASGALTQDNSNLFFDDTNNRLGIATASPTTPLDVFGSGIIGRLNATSTNNSYLGFASNGTNKWSAGNVQSDHRFRIFSEANSAELITILQTGEFGIGISNPTTKFHIDGAASALIANLDANVSIAKSVSYRSDNSARINLEVSGTESGSNVGADFFLRTFTDAGSLLETPFTIVRSTGVTTIKSLTLTNALSVANGGTGAATQNFVDLTTTQSVGGAKTLTSALAGTSASFSSTATATAFIPSGATIPTNGMYLSAANTLNFATNTTNRLSISSSGAATFSSSIQSGNISIPTATSSESSLFVQTANSDMAFAAYSSTYTGVANYASKAVIQAGNAGSGTGQLLLASWETAGIMTFYTGGRTSGFERMRITSGGQVGIGMTPGADRQFMVKGIDATSNNFVVTFQNTSAYLFQIRNDGLIYTGTAALSPYNYGVSGGVALYVGSSGQLGYNSSTRQSKTNIVNIENVEWLKKLTPVNFNKRKVDDDNNYLDEFESELEYGLIAEDVQEVNNDMVFSANDGKLKGVHYDKLIVPILKLVQEQQLQIEELKALINK